MSTSRASDLDGSERLPLPALLVLALAGFVMIMTETLPAGLLVPISRDLDVSTSAAGQLVSVYAAGTVLAAVPTIAATRTRPRKPLLLIGVAGFVVVNAATAVSSAYALTLCFRFVAGSLSGLVWGLIPGYARRIVPTAVAGRGLSIAMLGTPVALSMGTPLGTFVGVEIGWRWAFFGLSVAAALVIVMAIVALPDAPGQRAASATPSLRVLAKPGVMLVLVIVMLWMLAHNILYIYIAPYLTATGTGERVDLILLIFGFAALVGIWLTGVLVDRALRRITLLSLAGFGVAAGALLLGSHISAAVVAAVIVWGLTFGGASTQLNTAAIDAAGADRDIAAAWVSTAWNLAIFGGGILGGLLLDLEGALVLPWAVLALVIPALLIAGHAVHNSSAVPGP